MNAFHSRYFARLWAPVHVFIALSLTAALTAGPVESLRDRISQATPRPVLADPAAKEALVIEGSWKDGLWSGTVRNPSDKPVAVHEIVLFEGEHGLDSKTPIYGESFQMLAQITGTLAEPQDLGAYPDRKHYRIPEPEGYRAASGLLTLSPRENPSLALAFTSCNKFIGRIGFNSSSLKIFLNTEDLALAPKASWKLESFGCFTAKTRDASLTKVAQQILKNHPRTLPSHPPVGWCSWYTFYEKVTEPDIVRNLTFSKQNLPQVRYIQIDDGYQPKMGDWLDTGNAFGGQVQHVLKTIKENGFEPAIWVAPFIAEKTSTVFQQHPDWFVKGDDGQPLDSSTVGFGGFRCAPWYVLDGTHPAVQKHLENVFKTMREQWGVTYFKLDANYWGAIHGGHHYDPSATRIDAYRQGMMAIQKGADNAFILGCNAPIWPSLGLVDGMRTSGDTDRAWKTIKSCGLENLSRKWQNGILWWNDPDCVVLNDFSEIQPNDRPRPAKSEVSEDEFKLHVASIRASGGMVLSGDELAKIQPDRMRVLKKLLTPTGKAMQFDSSDFAVGTVKTGDKTSEVALFNWDDQPIERSFTTSVGSSITDFWTGESTVATTKLQKRTIPAHTALLLELQSGSQAPKGKKAR